ESHRSRHSHEKERARITRENFNFPGAEGKSGIMGIVARGCISERAEADGESMRAHVPTVRQERHRVKPPARPDLDHHHCSGYPHNQLGAALGSMAAGVKNVAMGPGA